MTISKDKGESMTTGKLPIATSDAPLVIDLPDGQKIVLGSLSSGAVIEVATWRGTGRPDSRTNRIMLGMSDQAQLNAPKHKSESKANENTGARKFLPSVKIRQNDMVVNTEDAEIKVSKLKSIKNLFKLAEIKFQSIKAQNEAMQPKEETIDLDIDAWINKISAEISEPSNKANFNFEELDASKKKPKSKINSSKKGKPKKK